MVVSNSVDANCRDASTSSYSSNTRDTSNRTDGKDGIKPVKEWKLAKKQGRSNSISSSNSIYEGNSSSRIRQRRQQQESEQECHCPLGAGEPTTARTSTRWHKKKDLIQLCSFTMKQLFVPHGKSTFSKMHTLIFISAIPIGFQMANQKTTRHTKTLKGSHRMEDGPIFLKTSASYTLMTIYRMNPVLVGSILPDSTFKPFCSLQIKWIFSSNRKLSARTLTLPPFLPLLYTHYLSSYPLASPLFILILYTVIPLPPPPPSQRNK